VIGLVEGRPGASGPP